MLRAAFLALLAAALLAAPAGAAWGPPELLAGGASPRSVVTNPRGDVAVLLGSGSGIGIAYAPAGARFGPVERLTDHAPYFADVALAGNGDVFVIAEGPGGGHRVAIRPAGGQFGPWADLPGVGQFADVAAGPDGQGLISGTSGDRGAGFWWREPGGSFVRTAQPDVGVNGRALVAFAGRRAMVAWADGGAALRMSELRDGVLADQQELARGGQVQANALVTNGRGDLLLHFQARELSDPGYPHRALFAPAGQPLGEVPSPATLAADGTLAILRGERGPIELRPPAGGPAELVDAPADVDRDGGTPFVTFDPEGRLQLFGSERKSAAVTRVEFAQRAPDGAWCPTRPWDGSSPALPVITAGTGDRGVAAWTVAGPKTYVSWFRPGERCPAPWVEPPPPVRATPDLPPVLQKPLAAPRGLRAARRGTRLVVRWRPVAGAARYKVAARLAGGRPARYVRRLSRRRALVGGVRRGGRVTVTVRAVARDGRVGRAGKLRVRRVR